MLHLIPGRWASRVRTQQPGILLVLRVHPCHNDAFPSCSRSSCSIATLLAVKKVDTMKNALARPVLSLHHVPLYAVIVASIASVVLLAMHFMEMGWQLWLVAILILLVWSPVFFYKARSIYQRHRWVAFFFILLVAQSVHFTEHIAQMVQIHILGLSGSQAHGIIGVLDFEWMHFFFDACFVPICVYTLFVLFRKSNPWLWVLLPVVTWHMAEHIAIMNSYLRTGIVGSPGLLAHGGAIARGLPITRPDLHFLYNLAEETLIVVAYLSQVRQLDAAEKQPAPPVPAAPVQTQAS